MTDIFELSLVKEFILTFKHCTEGLAQRLNWKIRRWRHVCRCKWENYMNQVHSKHVAIAPATTRHTYHTTRCQKCWRLTYEIGYSTKTLSFCIDRWCTPIYGLQRRVLCTYEICLEVGVFILIWNQFNKDFKVNSLLFAKTPELTSSGDVWNPKLLKWA